MIFKPDRTDFNDGELVTRAHIQNTYKKALDFKDPIVVQIEDKILQNKLNRGNNEPVNEDSIWKSGIDWDEKDSKLYRFDSLGSHTQGNG